MSLIGPFNRIDIVQSILSTDFTGIDPVTNRISSNLTYWQAGNTSEGRFNALKNVGVFSENTTFEDYLNSGIDKDVNSIMENYSRVEVNGKKVEDLSYEELQEFLEDKGVVNEEIKQEIKRLNLKYVLPNNDVTSNPYEKSGKTSDATSYNQTSTGNFPAQQNCSQFTAHDYRYLGNPQPFPEETRRSSYISMKEIKDAGDGVPPGGWLNWEITVNQVLNPLVAAGYWHNNFTFSSSYRPPPSSRNHSFAGAIDISAPKSWAPSKLYALANMANGIIKLGLPHDQLLFETNGSKGSGWVHVQVLSPSGNAPRYIRSTCYVGDCSLSNKGAGISIEDMKANRPQAFLPPD